MVLNIFIRIASGMKQDNIFNKVTVLFLLHLFIFQYAVPFAVGVQQTSKLSEEAEFTVAEDDNRKFVQETVLGVLQQTSYVESDLAILKRRSANSSTNEDLAPSGIPRSILRPWFPSHRAQPTDLPETQDHEPVVQLLDPQTENTIHIVTEEIDQLENNSSKRQIQAFLQDDFAIEVEEDDYDHEGDEQPVDLERKPDRVRRDLQNQRQMRRQLAQVMKQRRQIAKQRRLATTPVPRAGAPTRKPRVRPGAKRQTKKKPTPKKPGNRGRGVRNTPRTGTMPRTPRGSQPPRSQRGSPKPRTLRGSPQPRTGTRRPQPTPAPRARGRAPTRKPRVTPDAKRQTANKPTPKIPGNRGRGMGNTPQTRTTPRTPRDSQPPRSQTGSPKPKTLMGSPMPRTGTRRPQTTVTKPSETTRTNVSTTPTQEAMQVTNTPKDSMHSNITNTTPMPRSKVTRKPSSSRPKEQGSTPAARRNLSTNTPPKNRPKSAISSKRNRPNSPKNGFTRPKSTKTGTVTVVKPVLLQDGQKTTTVQQRQRKRVMNDLPQAGNNRPRLTFSKWGAWSLCQAVECGTSGTQMRTRSCFANKLTPADYAVCNYNSLVDQRSCSAPACSTTTKAPVTTVTPEGKKTFRWTPWSKCSVTCGEGGKQTRTKICYKMADDGSEEMALTDCPEETVESRPCQYSISCPIWDSWSDWSLCSRTCGAGGVSFRERKCTVERYVSFRGRNGQRRQFDYKPKPTQKTAKPKKKNSLNRPKIKSSQNGNRRGQGFAYLKNGRKVFIVDAPKPRLNSLPSQRPVPEFHENESVKEFVDVKLCRELGGSSEEERICVQDSCPAEWGTWSSWSSCSVTCGMGISRRERSCSEDSTANACVGRKYAYRRCYAPPCWGEWSNWSGCSVSCGYQPGIKQRKRNCIGTTSVIHDYTYCEGADTDKEECLSEPCPGDVWSNWGPYGPCSATCNGGYKLRTRTCRASKCTGPSEDLGRCNVIQCPTWSKWSLFSCCSVSCGEGIRRRTRNCANGDVSRGDCVGADQIIEPCYMAPCDSTQKGVFGSFRCGIGSVSNLKTIAKLRIFGGTKSAAHDWPWQTSWQHRDSVSDNWQHFCGATLLHPRWVITASHCTEESEYIVNHRNPGNNWSVVVGMVKLYRDGDRYFVERIFVHPRYQYKSVTRNDVALLKLRKMVPITKEVMPACMPRGMRPSPGEECYITGWGYATGNPNASLSLSLREASIPILRFQQCRTLGDYYQYFLDPSLHMCAGNPVTAAADSCTGDSGGPLVCGRNKRWYLGAVTSFGFADCGTPGHVGIYAPMDTYEEWVRTTLQAHTYERC